MASLSKETIAEKVGALGLTIGIIIGRWLLPRGAITREQLSALLIGYVGIAADILEVFELFEEENLMYQQSITIATLFVFSWCLLSFCLVTTATTSREKGVAKQRANKVLQIRCFNMDVRKFSPFSWRNSSNYYNQIRGSRFV